MNLKVLKHMNNVDNPCEEYEVANVEAMLSLKLNAEYREIIKLVGRVSLDGADLTGISDDIEYNIIKQTQRIRKKNKNFPSDHYVIENLYSEDVVVSQDENGCIYFTLGRGKPVWAYDTLDDYLITRVN